MAWIADGNLATAVSNGGGLGIIAEGNAPGSYIAEQIKIAKRKTDKPIGVNIMLMSPFADEVAKVVVEESLLGPCPCQTATQTSRRKLALKIFL